MDRPIWHTILGRLEMHGGWKRQPCATIRPLNQTKSHLRWGCAPWDNERMYQQDVSRQVWVLRGPFTLLLLLASPPKPGAILLGASVTL